MAEARKRAATSLQSALRQMPETAPEAIDADNNQQRAEMAHAHRRAVTSLPNELRRKPQTASRTVAADGNQDEAKVTDRGKRADTSPPSEYRENPQTAFRIVGADDNQEEKKVTHARKRAALFQPRGHPRNTQTAPRIVGDENNHRRSKRLDPRKRAVSLLPPSQLRRHTTTGADNSELVAKVPARKRAVTSLSGKLRHKPHMHPRIVGANNKQQRAKTAHARKRVTFLPSQVPEEEDEPLDDYGLRIWTQPSYLAASHEPLHGEPAVHTYERLYKGNLFQRAEAPPTMDMLAYQKAAWSSAFQDPDVTKDRIIADEQAAAQRRRTDAQDAHVTFKPYFEASGLIPVWKTEDEKDHKEDIYESARMMKPEQESPRQEVLPRPRSATLPTFKPHCNYRSPFYPTMDAEDVRRTSLEGVGMGRGGSLGSGVFIPLRRPRALSTVFETPYPPLDESEFSQPQKDTAQNIVAPEIAAPVQNIETAEVEAQTVIPRDTPRKANPGQFSVVTPHLSQAARIRSNSEANAVVEAITRRATDLQEASHRGRFSFGVSRKRRRMTDATVKFPQLDIGHSYVDSDYISAQVAMIVPQKKNIRKRAATTASGVANILHMGKLAQDFGEIATKDSPAPQPRDTPHKPAMRKRAMTAAAHASHHLAKKAAGAMHRRRYSDLEKDLMGRNRPRITKKERAPKGWDPAKPEFQYPHFQSPPTPGLPASELFGTPDREIKTIIRNDPIAAQQRLAGGWHTTHNLKVSSETEYEDLENQINERLNGVEMTDDETDDGTDEMVAATVPRNGKDKESQAEKKEARTVKRHNEEAERNAKNTQRAASAKSDVLARDPDDVFGDNTETDRKRSGSVRRRSGSIKSGHSVSSFKSFFAHGADFRKWRPLSLWSLGARKGSPAKGTPQGDEMDNAGGAFRVGKVERIASVTAEVPGDAPQTSPTRATISGSRPDIGVPLTPSHKRVASAPGILKTTPGSTKSAPRSGSSGVMHSRFADPESPTPYYTPRQRRPTVMFQPIIEEQQFRLNDAIATLGHNPPPPVFAPPPLQYPYNIGAEPEANIRRRERRERRKQRRDTGPPAPPQFDGGRSPKRQWEDTESEESRPVSDDRRAKRLRTTEPSAEESFDDMIRRREKRDENDAKERRRYAVDVLENWGREAVDGTESIPQVDGCGMSVPLTSLKRKFRGPVELELADRSDQFQRRRQFSDANEGHRWRAMQETERARRASYNAWVAGGDAAQQQQQGGEQKGGEVKK